MKRRGFGGMSSPAQIKMAIGALTPPMHEQLDLPEGECVRIQGLHDAIVRLRVRGLLTDGDLGKVARRFIKLIGEEVGAWVAVCAFNGINQGSQ